MIVLQILIQNLSYKQLKNHLFSIPKAITYKYQSYGWSLNVFTPSYFKCYLNPQQLYIFVQIPQPKAQLQYFMSFGFPTSNKAIYTVDTSAKREEFMHTIKLSEKYWAEDQFEESLVKLRIAIKIGKFIIENELPGPVKDSFKNKLVELAAREQDRTNQMKDNKPIQYTNNGGGGGKGGKNDNDNDKMIGAMSQAIVTEKPNVRWEDISGLENAKSALKQAVILPIRFPQIFTGARKPWKGILLYGPPGTGKTFLAKACATEANGTFFSVSSSDLMSKYVGQSEKLIKTLFNLARDKKPSIIFIDEVDSMCGKRSEGGESNEASRRVKTQFLVQMQGVGKDDQGILVLGATNLPWDLDPAIRRRFQRRIYISLPEKQARYGMLKKGFKDNKNNITEAQLQYFAERTEGFSGSDIAILVKDAVYQPVRKLQAARRFRKLPNGKMLPVTEQQFGQDIVQGDWMTIPKQNIEIPIICVQDLQTVMKKTKPSVDRTQLKQYEQWTNEFGQDG